MAAIELTELEEYQLWANSLGKFKPDNKEFTTDPKTIRLLWMLSEFTAEVGEINEILAKNVRKFGTAKVDDPDTVARMDGELGDAFFWIASIAHEFGLSLDDIVLNNIEKLNTRAQEAT